MNDLDDAIMWALQAVIVGGDEYLEYGEDRTFPKQSAVDLFKSKLEQEGYEIIYENPELLSLEVLA